MIRVLLADDHELVRAGVRRVLETTGGMTVVGEASRGDEALTLMQQLEPDLLLLDLHMPGGPSLAAIPAMFDASPQTRIVVLTMQDSAAFVREALRAGALGYVTK